MKPTISILTLGVADLKISVHFYKDGLGFPTNYQEGDGIAFFQLQGTWLALFPSDALAEDAGLPPGRTDFGGITLAHNVSTKEEVDQVLAQAFQAGARPLRKAADMFWGGYSGYFADPDGHPWEVAWNPALPLA